MNEANLTHSKKLFIKGQKQSIMSDAESSKSLSDSSESDDDEYLLSSSHENREAMIRRKLLESFYGTTSPTATASTNLPDEELDDATAPTIGDSHNGQVVSTKEMFSDKKNSSGHRKSADLDSIHFHPSLYTSQLIHHGDTLQILKETNQLSQSIRLLDSTMQTLVYENYSKFISATGAIRSIGQSVDQSNEGLETLRERMQRIEENAKLLESNVSEKRQQVVEKLKLKRLLNRLTRLVELPKTLAKMKSEGQYKSFMRDYLDAMKILTQHTENFESLKSIQGDCKIIVCEMLEEVGYKMWIWCGGNRNVGVGRRRTHIGKAGILDKFWIGGRTLLGVRDTGVLDSGSPTSVEEIYECAGSLFMYAKNEHEPIQALEEKERDINDEDSHEHIKDTNVLADLTHIECKTIALESVSLYLEALLEDHAIDVQEFLQDPNVTEHSLYPAKFLDKLLDAVTQFRQTFYTPVSKDEVSYDDGEITENDAAMLKDYVTLWFDSFLAHVKNNVLEWIAETSQDYNASKEDDDDEIFASVSNELLKFVRSVRDLASRLALPEVGLDMDVASSLVERSVVITESMVKRRVMQKFKLLRVKVIRQCLIPFVDSFQGDNLSGDSSRLATALQSANTTLSDGMQYIDDTIRSIMCNGIDSKGSNTPLDVGMVKMAVVKNARAFALWLAVTIETMSIHDFASDDVTLELQPLFELKDEQTKKDLKKLLDTASSVERDSDGYFDQQVLQELLEHIPRTIKGTGIDMLNLGLLEMCRLAQRHLAGNINQSISNSVDDNSNYHEHTKERKRDVRDDVDSDKLVTNRFLLASSTLIAVYTMDRGYEAATAMCHDIPTTSIIQSELFPHGPSDAAVKMLEVVRRVCLACAQVFDESPIASDIPNFADDYRQNMSMVGSLGHTSNLGFGIGPTKGLSLDVARMFTQKVQVYSQSLRKASLSRDFVVNALLRVAFRAWNEQLRLSSLSLFAYRQIQVDVEFLKYLLPHFLSEDSAEFEMVCTLLNDLLLNAGERCLDSRFVGAIEYYDETMNRVISPLLIALRWLKEEEAAGGRGALENIVINKNITDKM
jgi:hypothetical protein